MLFKMLMTLRESGITLQPWHSTNKPSLTKSFWAGAGIVTRISNWMTLQGHMSQSTTLIPRSVHA